MGRALSERDYVDGLATRVNRIGPREAPPILILCGFACVNFRNRRNTGGASDPTEIAHELQMHAASDLAQNGRPRPRYGGHRLHEGHHVETHS